MRYILKMVISFSDEDPFGILGRLVRNDKYE